MINFFGNVKLRTRIMMTGLIPLLGMLGLAAYILSEEYTNNHNLLILRQLGQVTVAAGNFAHTSQKERGLSAMFITSGGTAAKAELQQARTSTDQAKQVLESSLQQIPSHDLNTTLFELKSQTEKSLATISTTREHVDDLSFTAKDSFKAYCLVCSCFPQPLATS